MAFANGLVRGREAFSHRQWVESFTELSTVDQQSQLGPDDLERLATAAYLLGLDAEAIAAWTRLHHLCLNQSTPDRAARWGFWLSLTCLLAGEPARGTGWLSRTKRILAEHGQDCVEQGYVIVLDGLMAMVRGKNEDASAMSDEAISIANRFADRDLLALGLLEKGQAVIGLKRQAEGVAFLDEAMIGVSAQEVSPILMGIIYCAVIRTCQSIFDLGRAREWTMQLNDWCVSQPDLKPFRGQCLVHRSEVLQQQGDWSSALEEARNACRHLDGGSEALVGRAYYQLGELCRLMGDFDQAHRMFRKASLCGCEPQPGSALLLLSTGKGDAAASIRTVFNQSNDGPGPFTSAPRARLLAPTADILLAADDIGGARAIAEELSALAEESGAAFLLAAAAQTAGSVALAEGRFERALSKLREAWTAWQQLQMPYESARVRVCLGRVCNGLGDQESARMHYEAAHAVFSRLGAVPDLIEIERLTGARQSNTASRLTGRELEVLILVASGASNRQIASRLNISEHTVARHISNILDKLGASSRTQAVALAHANNLL